MTQPLTSNHSVYKHAIVIGGSIAGLTTARVLSDHFELVTVVERDEAPVANAFRSGAPQARHPHALLARGQAILEEMFPGIVKELVAGGGIPANFGQDCSFFMNGHWCQKFESSIVSTICSRPLLEATIYRRLANLPNVRFLHRQEVLGLVSDESKQRATGVQLRQRQGSTADPVTVEADLIVDASGRNSQAPEWLTQLGYTQPSETVIDAHVGYSTRIFRKPANFNGDWKALYVMALYPHQRGALILPLEGDRWHALLIGMAGDYPPTDEAGFLEFARSLPTPAFYDAIKDAEPLTAPYGYRKVENRMRHYEKLPRHLENFLVTGDAVYGFNPVYGQGMSAAALASQALEASLTTQRKHKGEATLEGLAQHFQAELVKVVAGPWQMATGQDVRWPGTEGGQAPDPVTRLVQRYLDRVLERVPFNPHVAEAFYQVQNMLQPPTSLFHPKILWHVLKPQPRSPMQTQALPQVKGSAVGAV